MLEARVKSAAVLKKLLDAIRDLVTEANFEASEDGIGLQAMDNSHVALVTVQLDAGQFDNYRCDRNMPLGVNLGSLTKILKCAKDNDVVTLKASDDADSLGLVFESPNSDRVGEYEMKLMDIDQEHLGIPDTAYDATITMSSSEFQRICRDLAALGESVKIDVNKEGVKFSSEGEVGSGSVLLKQTAGRDRVKDEGGKKASKTAKASKKAAKRDPDDDDEEMDDDDEDVKPDVEDDEEEEEEEEEEEAPSKKRKATTNGKGAAPKKAKTDDEEDIGVTIVLQQHVSLTFSLKYLQNFAKSAPLAKKVTLNMSNEVPLLVAFDFEQGHINYYLAPKIGDD